MIKILVIGSDSFIAKAFILQTKTMFSIKGVSRMKTDLDDEYLLSDFSNLPKFLFTNIDVVVNFAAIVHQPQITNIHLFNLVNHELAITIANMAKNAGVKLFVQMSTIAVYGSNDCISLNSSFNPQTPYALSKLHADIDLLNIQDEKFLVTIIRPPMVYGVGNAPGNMMRLIQLADKGIPLPFKNIGNCRDFIHVHNLCKYLSIIVQEKLNGVFLVTDNQPISTEYLLSVISKLLGKKVILIKLPYIMLKVIKLIIPKEFDKLFGSLKVTNNFPNKYQFEKTTVEQGLSEMVDWYMKNKTKQ